MKKLFLLAFVILMALILLNRQRVFVRNPLATVYKSPAPGHTSGAGELKLSGVHVFINYSNDVLLEKDAEPGAYRILVQHWNRLPVTPAELKCIYQMACLTDADQATAIPIAAPGKSQPIDEVAMSDHEATFAGPDGAILRVVLR